MRKHRNGAHRARRSLAFGVVWALRAAAFGLLFLPILLVVLLSFSGDAYTTLPPQSYSLRWYANAMSRGEFVESFMTSVQVAALATPLSVVIGTLAAYGLWKYPRPGARALESLLMAPILLPLVVTGLALLVFFNRGYLHTGLWSIVLAHVIVTFPYSFRSVLAVLARYDRQLDEAAASLRVHPARAFWHVTLPMIRPGLFAGALFAFVMSFDDFATTIFLITPGTKTLPIAIYQYMEFNLDPTVSAVSAMLVLLSVVGVLVIDKILGMDRFVGLRA
ncbi:Inner membrane ABC transporter permease protein YdcV [Variovorax sp. PBL-H6]|uniref:ABC transporter permease n=1 Tax=Variovorax sp. PBL-H6 TaxID=434009 RepID=UPI0013186F5F|nr:ABC transporter permease [Variovorax sp. PBL-H6]VTU15169.1 Inner membrane ABC transporter permease protein YdcV [Variovorax sp. PBL-H6]